MGHQVAFPTIRDNFQVPTLTLTEKERLGRIGEQVVKSPLQKACGELGLTLVWTGEKAYMKGRNAERRDVDFKVYCRKRLLKVYEAKNWKWLQPMFKLIRNMFSL